MLAMERQTTPKRYDPHEITARNTWLIYHTNITNLEREIEHLRSENERLASENNSLRSAVAPAAAMAYIAKKFNLATGDRELDENEIEGLCRTLCNAQSLSILARFVDDHDMRDSDLAYCVDGIVRGDEFPVAFFWEEWHELQGA